MRAETPRRRTTRRRAYALIPLQRELSLALLVAAGYADAGCAANEPTLAHPASETSSAGANDGNADSRPEHSSDYVIAAGLRWLVTFDAGPLSVNLKRLAPEVLPEGNVKGFERSTGLALDALRDVSIAGFDYSTLYIVNGVRDVDTTRLRFAAQFPFAPAHTDVGARRLYTGVSSDEVTHYATIDGDTALWSEGDPVPAKAALLLAQGLLRRSPSATKGAALGLLPGQCTRGHFVAQVPGPVELPPEADPGASLVMSATLALAVGFTLEAETLAVKVCWVGDWQHDGLARTKTVLDTLLTGRFATLLDLTPDERRGSFSQANELVTVEYRWAAAKVITRVQSVLSLDLAAIFAPDNDAPRKPPSEHVE